MMNRAFKVTLLTIGIVLPVVFDSLAADPPEVKILANATIQKDKLVVEGMVTVPDGALLSYEITDAKFRSGSGLTGKTLGGNILVKGKSFNKSFPLNQFSRGEIEVWLGFQTITGPEKQPKEVIDLYGELGEKLKGSQVTTAGNLKRVELALRVQKR
jgi:hypothetical protein